MSLDVSRMCQEFKIAVMANYANKGVQLFQNEEDGYTIQESSNYRIRHVFDKIAKAE